MNYKTTIDHALHADKEGRLREWVDKFLMDEGANAKLAQHIREHPNAEIIFKEYPLKGLRRIMGPEKSMIWQEGKSTWDARIERINNYLNTGNRVPPLIATDFWGDLHLSDGNHRHEALMQAGVKKYWIIFCLEKPENIAIVKAN